MASLPCLSVCFAANVCNLAGDSTGDADGYTLLIYCWLDVEAHILLSASTSSPSDNVIYAEQVGGPAD